MKYAFSLLLVASLVFSCVACSSSSTQPNDDPTPSQTQTTKKAVEEGLEITFEEFSSSLYEWDESDITMDAGDIEKLYEAKPITSKADAVEVGKLIGSDPTYQSMHIIHYTGSNVWLFQYSPNRSNTPVDELADGGCLDVVIDGNTGKVILAWAGE